MLPRSLTLVSLSAMRTMSILTLAGTLCLALGQAMTAQANQDDEMEARIKHVDMISDGRLGDYIKTFVDMSNTFGNFKDYLDEHPQVAREYRRLLVSAVRKGDWGAAFVVQTAPPRLMLDIWIDELRPGGEFRDRFVENMGSRKVGAIGALWKIFEDQSNLQGGYRLYKEYMREHPVEEAAPLIEYLLRAYPLTAMDALLEIYPDQLPDAAAVFDDHWTVKKADWMYEHGMHRGEAPREAIDALNRLSRHDAWWVRLYALSAMTERGPFRLPHRVRDLRDDPNDAVNRAANAISPPEDRRGGARNQS